MEQQSAHSAGESILHLAGGVQEVVTDASQIRAEMRDYRWIKFAVNAEYGVDSEQMVKYPGDQNYNDRFRWMQKIMTGFLLIIKILILMPACVT